MKLEAVVLPVADVDRAKRFYGGLGWRLDADFSFGDWRVVQFTPPGSPCSIHFGKGVTNATPGSYRNVYLVVSDIVAARDELRSKGADVGDVWHVGAKRERVQGRDPDGKSYGSFASFADPDGNTWLLQEVTTRLPGRMSFEVDALVGLLREAEMRHGAYEATAPKHHWSDWYGAYIVARQSGRSPDEAIQDAGRHMAEILK